MFSWVQFVPCLFTQHDLITMTCYLCLGCGSSRTGVKTHTEDSIGKNVLFVQQWELILIWQMQCKTNGAAWIDQEEEEDVSNLNQKKLPNKYWVNTQVHQRINKSKIKMLLPNSIQIFSCQINYKTDQTNWFWPCNFIYIINEIINGIAVCTIATRWRHPTVWRQQLLVTAAVKLDLYWPSCALPQTFHTAKSSNDLDRKARGNFPMSFPESWATVFLLKYSLLIYGDTKLYILCPNNSQTKLIDPTKSGICYEKEIASVCTVKQSM